MTMPRLPQFSLAGGVASPSIAARPDLAKYQTLLREALNVYGRPEGGQINRPGLQFVGELYYSGTIGKLVPFVFDPAPDQSYVLVINSGELRVVRDGGQILKTAKTVTSVTSASPPVVTLPAAHGFANGTEVFFTTAAAHPLNDQTFVVADVTSTTFTLKDRTGAYVDGSAWPAASGIEVAELFQISTPFYSSRLPRMKHVQDGDLMFLLHKDLDPRRLSRLAEDNWTIDTPAFAPAMAAPTNLTAVASYALDYNVGGFYFRVSSVTADGKESLPSPQSNLVYYAFENPKGSYIGLDWTPVTGAAYYNIYRDLGTGALVATAIEPPAEVRNIQTGGSDWKGTADAGSPPRPAAPTATKEFGEEMTYAVSAISAETGEESLLSNEVTVLNDLSWEGNVNVLSWDAVAGAERYIVYKKDKGSFGYVGSTESTVFRDTNFAADVADGPQYLENPFSGAGEKPSVGTFFEQRLVLAGISDDPRKVFMSSTANYLNFCRARPVKATDAIEFRLRARKAGEVRGLVPARQLLVLSHGAEFAVAGSGGEAITPSNVRSQPQGERGSGYLEPLMLGGTVITASARSSTIKAMSYSFADDAYVDKDLTILSRHLFEGYEITSWAYAQAPHSIVYAVRNDGKLLTMTWQQEHDVSGWTLHETDGLFEDVTTIPEGDEDAVYCIVKRTIGGVTRRFVERFASRAVTSIEDGFFVDSGVTYEGAATTTIGKLHHLEGKTVNALADGVVVRDLVVTDGQVTLPFAAAKVHVGLPYTSRLSTLDMDLGTIKDLGSVAARYKAPTEIQTRVVDTAGLWIGQYGSTLQEPEWATPPSWDEPVQLRSEFLRVAPFGTYDQRGSVTIEQRDPLPMHVVAIAPDGYIGG